MDEIISGIHVIKMYAWEWPFTRMIALGRKMELRYVRRSSYVRALYMTFMLFTTRMAMFCTMLAIVLLYGQAEITVPKVFTVSAYFNVISIAMSQMFVRGITEVAEGLIAFKRLQDFLNAEEKADTASTVDSDSKTIDSSYDSIAEEVCHTHVEFILHSFWTVFLFVFGSQIQKIRLIEEAEQVDDNVIVSIRNATARWISLTSTRMHRLKLSKNKCDALFENGFWRVPTLENINAAFPKGKLIGIIGPVGEGKSSFLQALLRELPLESGTIRINGTISYACQEPWVFAGSIRQNILFGQKMDRHRYDSIIASCALQKDLDQLPHGDKTMIGERGQSLSGGQKARIK